MEEHERVVAEERVARVIHGLIRLIRAGGLYDETMSVKVLAEELVKAFEVKGEKHEQK